MASAQSSSKTALQSSYIKSAAPRCARPEGGKRRKFQMARQFEEIKHDIAEELRKKLHAEQEICFLLIEILDSISPGSEKS